MSTPTRLRAIPPEHAKNIAMPDLDAKDEKPEPAKPPEYPGQPALVPIADQPGQYKLFT